jgi:predicted nucleotidyltransferase
VPASAFVEATRRTWRCSPSALVSSAEDNTLMPRGNPLVKREEILRITARHGARNVRLFGSWARGDATADSDVDLLVEVDAGRSMLDVVALWQELTELLACDVDVLTDGGVSPYLRDRIYAEARPL